MKSIPPWALSLAAGSLLALASPYLRTVFEPATPPTPRAAETPRTIFDDKGLWSALEPGDEVMVAEGDPTPGLEGRVPFDVQGTLTQLPSGTKARVSRRYRKGDREVELLITEGPRTGLSGRAYRTNVRPLK